MTHLWLHRRKFFHQRCNWAMYSCLLTAVWGLCFVILLGPDLQITCKQFSCDVHASYRVTVIRLGAIFYFLIYISVGLQCAAITRRWNRKSWCKSSASDWRGQQLCDLFCFNSLGNFHFTLWWPRIGRGWHGITRCSLDITLGRRNSLCDTNW